MTKPGDGETQESICAWAEKTFGPVKNPIVLVDRAAIELSELREAVLTGDRTEVGKETADICILLARLVNEFQLNLDREITSKMAENRKRRWLPKGDGTGSHVRP